MKKSRLVIATSLLALVASAGLASAQPGGPGGGGGGGGYGPPPAPPPGVYRSGFIAGFSIGGGSMVPDCEGCDSESGMAADFHLGGMITPRLAIMWDGSGVVAEPEEGVTLVNAINTAAIQYWVAPKIWIKGGLGFGRLSVDVDGQSADTESGAAILGAAGFELMQRPTFAIDASVRFVSVAYDGDDFSGEKLTLTNVSVNVGFNWY